MTDLPPTSKLPSWLIFAVSALGVIFLGVIGVVIYRLNNTSLPEPLTVEERLTVIAETQAAAPPALGLTPQAADTEAKGIAESSPPALIAATETPPIGATSTPSSTHTPLPTITPGGPTATPTLLPTFTTGPTQFGGFTQTPTPSVSPTASPEIGPTGTLAAVTGSGPQPGPSPTYVLRYMPTPMPAFGPSKLGFHVTGNVGMVEFAAAVQPSVMKGVEEISYLEGVKAVSPNTVTIGRYIVDEWQHRVGQGDPVQQAIDFVNDQLPRYLEHAAYVDYWEGYNEIGVNHIEWYGRFEAARACEMQRHGLRAALGSWSTGVPEPFQFEAFLPAIEAGIECDAILTLHEYGAPTYYLWWSQGIPSVGQWYPDRGPLAGRYRWLYRDILIPRGLVIPLAITEAGIDGLVGMGLRPGPSGPAGWLELTDYWMAEGLTNDPVQFYVDQLIWYDSILRQDSYVIGATIYTVAGGCCPQQASYEASSIVPRLIAYMQSLR